MAADFGSVSLKMAGSLILVLGLIIGLYYLFKRLRPGSLSFNNYPEMRLIGTLNLAPKKSIALIEICDQWLVVGIGAENVTLISKLDRTPDINDTDTLPTGNEGRFHSLLQNRFPWQRGRKTIDKKKDAKS